VANITRVIISMISNYYTMNAFTINHHIFACVQ